MKHVLNRHLSKFLMLICGRVETICLETLFGYKYSSFFFNIAFNTLWMWTVIQVWITWTVISSDIQNCHKNVCTAHIQQILGGCESNICTGYRNEESVNTFLCWKSNILFLFQNKVGVFFVLIKLWFCYNQIYTIY